MKAFIFWLEMLAQVLSVLVVAAQVRGHVLCFVDNSAAEHALQKGFSKDSFFTKVLGCFARVLASKSIALSFHRVSSAANASDGVSRDDWSSLAASLGCVRQDFDFTSAYDWLRRLSELPEDALFTTFVKFAEDLCAQSVGEQRAIVEGVALFLQNGGSRSGTSKVRVRRPRNRSKTFGSGERTSESSKRIPSLCSLRSSARRVLHVEVS